MVLTKTEENSFVVSIQNKKAFRFLERLSIFMLLLLGSNQGPSD